MSSGPGFNDSIISGRLRAWGGGFFFFLGGVVFFWGGDIQLVFLMCSASINLFNRYPGCVV